MSNIKIEYNNSYNFTKVKFISFSDGAETCDLNLKHSQGVTSVRVTVDIEDCARDFMRLALVKEALDNLDGNININLSMFYTPFARADRRFSYGESHSLKVFCKLLNTLKFQEVLIVDPHSDVCTALIDNVKVINQTTCFKSLLPFIDKVSSDFILCAPDLGATKKIFDTVRAIGHEDYLQAVKIRDVKTGNIAKCDIQCGDLKGKDVVIVDDLCDGGASFKFLAEKLLTKSCGKVILFTSHGIYSKGLKPLEGYIDYIFCYNLMEKFINKRDIEIFNAKGE